MHHQSQKENIEVGKIASFLAKYFPPKFTNFQKLVLHLRRKSKSALSEISNGAAGLALVINLRSLRLLIMLLLTAYTYFYSLM